MLYLKRKQQQCRYVCTIVKKTYYIVSGLCGLTVERSLAILKVASSNLGRCAARKQPRTSCSHACASVTKQYNLVPADGRWRFSAGKVTAGLAESNGSLPLGGWLQVACGLTACTPGSALGRTLGNEYGRTLPFYPEKNPRQCTLETANLNTS